MIDSSIYIFINSIAPMLNLWVAMFFLLTLAKICATLLRPSIKLQYNSILSEIPGLPLTLLHTVCFIKAIYTYDVISATLFFWWGPGFILTAILVVYTKLRKINFNWAPLGLITSIACKINYLLFVIVYFYFGCYEIITAFSIWIIHDQINLAWFNDNADRTRRLTEDWWLVRIGYVAFLFMPIFVLNFSYRLETSVFGIILFILWAIGMVKVVKKGSFKSRPSHTKFLRNIVYLSQKKS